MNSQLRRLVRERVERRGPFAYVLFFEIVVTPVGCASETLDEYDSVRSALIQRRGRDSRGVFRAARRFRAFRNDFDAARVGPDFALAPLALEGPREYRRAPGAVRLRRARRGDVKPRHDRQFTERRESRGCAHKLARAAQLRRTAPGFVARDESRQLLRKAFEQGFVHGCVLLYARGVHISPALNA